MLHAHAGGEERSGRRRGSIEPGNQAAGAALEFGADGPLDIVQRAAFVGGFADEAAEELSQGVLHVKPFRIREI